MMTQDLDNDWPITGDSYTSARHFVEELPAFYHVAMLF